MDLLAVAAVLLSFFVKGLSGFANTLIFGTIMNFRSENLEITPLSTILSLPSNLFIAWKERRSIARRTFLGLTLIVIAGSVPGAFFLKAADSGLLRTVFGLLTIGFGVEMYFRERAGKRGGSKPVMLLIGFLSGIFSGLFCVSALLAAYVGRTAENASEFRGTLCAVFAADNIFRIVLYALGGILTGKILLDGLMLLPFAAAGLAAGILLSGRLQEKTVKKLVIFLLILSGAALIFKP
ncbi:MAG: sulfite exporter TauE/SafE family protein [Oscillospiraceae bacterium]|nr:sulfite exporter TauE/SafE family protein [Oscillospiraceae bacterium]